MTLRQIHYSTDVEALTLALNDSKARLARGGFKADRPAAALRNKVASIKTRLATIERVEAMTSPQLQARKEAIEAWCASAPVAYTASTWECALPEYNHILLRLQEVK